VNNVSLTNRLGAAGFFRGAGAGAIGIAVAFAVAYIPRPQWIAHDNMAEYAPVLIGLIVALWLWGLFVGGRRLAARSLLSALAGAGIAAVPFVINEVRVGHGSGWWLPVGIPFWALILGGVRLLGRTVAASVIASSSALGVAYAVFRILFSLAKDDPFTDTATALLPFGIAFSVWVGLSVILGLGILGAMYAPPAIETAETTEPREQASAS